ncbi:MAG: hypothetical protein KGI70_01950 [Patescibacteria group bacterium]|nr:hypothetical protein [Patescibacteria group bacterium]
MKVKAKELTDAQRIEILDTLYTTAGSVRGRAAMKLFLRDLLTESERIMLGRRILIARGLVSKKKYDEISAELKVGHDTIERVHKWLQDQLPGYESALKGLEQEFAKRKFKKTYSTSAWARLKAKYPGHFLLFSGRK